MIPEVRRLHNLMQRKLNILSGEPTVDQLQEGIPQLCKTGKGFFEYVRHGSGLYRKQWDVVGADTSAFGSPTYFSFYRNTTDTITLSDSVWSNTLDFDTVKTDSDGGEGDGSETWLPDSSYIVQTGREGTYFFSAFPMFGAWSPTSTAWISTVLEKTESDTGTITNITAWYPAQTTLSGNFFSAPVSGVFDMKGGDYVRIKMAAKHNAGDTTIALLGQSGPLELSTFSGFKIGD